MVRKNEKRGGPGLMHPDLDLILRATRDLFAARRGEARRRRPRGVRAHPRLRHRAGPGARDQRVVLHETDEPIFDAYGIEQEIQPRHRSARCGSRAAAT